MRALLAIVILAIAGLVYGQGVDLTGGELTGGQTGLNDPLPTYTPSVTPTATATATDTPAITNTPTQTPTITPTATATATDTPTITATPTITGTPTETGTPTITPTITVTPTITNTPNVTNTPTAAATRTGTINPPSTDIRGVPNLSLPYVKCAATPCPMGTPVPAANDIGPWKVSSCEVDGGTGTVQTYCWPHRGNWEGTPIPVQSPITCPGKVRFDETFEQCAQQVQSGNGAITGYIDRLPDSNVKFPK